MFRGDLSRFCPDKGKVGENVARTIRIVAKLLLDWSTAERDRLESQSGQKAGEKGSSARPPARKLPPLTTIYFDKLAMSFCRIWDELHRMRKVRYNAAFVTRRGFHGPGRAMSISRKADEELGKRPGDYRKKRFAYITEVVEKLKPSLGDARILFSLEGEPWDASCEVHPQLDGSVWEAWVRDKNGSHITSEFLLPSEQRFVDVFSLALAGLSKEEIRALGTHCSAEETSRDIEFNIRAWGKNFDAASKFLINGVGTRGEVSNAAYRLVTTAREVINKSGDNRTNYGAAWTKVRSSIRACPDLAEVFENIQKSEDVIWRNDRVVQYRSIAQDLIAFSIYVRRGIHNINIGTTLTPYELEEASASYTCLRNRFRTSKLVVLPYERIKDESKLEWGTLLFEMKREIFSHLPLGERDKDLGVP